MPDKTENVMMREMVLDLCYRLRLADDLFCIAADSVVTAMETDEFSAKLATLDDIREYAESLRIVAADFERIFDQKRLVFPPDVADWIWEQPNAETQISLYLERMHSNAHGMELVLDAELVKHEVRR